MATKLKTIQTRIPEELYEELEELVGSGLYANKSEVIREALRKLIAEKSRNVLRELAAEYRVSEESLLKEWVNLRKGGS